MTKDYIKISFIGCLLICAGFVISIIKILLFDPTTVSIQWIDAEKYFPHSFVQTLWTETNQPLYIFASDFVWDFQSSCLTNNSMPCPLFPHQEFVIDLQWMQHIQYVWKTLSREHVLFFVEVLDTITNISPLWTAPYVFAQVLWPIQRLSTVDEAIKTSSRVQTIQLWEKWIKYICDDKKIATILGLDDETFAREAVKIYKNRTVVDPCTNWDLPYHLAFTYFHYIQNAQKAADMYRVAAFDHDPAPVASQMPAIVLWQWGYYLKSAQLWFDKFLAAQKSGTQTQKEQDIFLKKAIMSYSLDIIQTTADAVDTSQSTFCFQDYNCMQTQWLIANEIEKRQIECQTKQTTVWWDISCSLLALGTQAWYITDVWFEYPLNTSDQTFIYARHPVEQKWWILPEDELESL